jgi:hypothetical protein
MAGTQINWRTDFSGAVNVETGEFMTWQAYLNGPGRYGDPKYYNANSGSWQSRSQEGSVVVALKDGIGMLMETTFVCFSKRQFETTGS